MITFLELGRLGRLGNQLFQYAALKSLGLTKGYEVKIPDPALCEWHGQHCLLENFSLECDYVSEQDVNSIQYSYFEPDINRYEDLSDLPDNTNLSGFFQSVKYFQTHEKQIKKEFKLKDQIELPAAETLAKIKKDKKCEIVSLHVRRGDVTDGTNEKPINYLGTNGSFESDSVFGRYFGVAKNLFANKKVKFLVFSGGSRTGDDDTSDIEWCRKNFVGDEFIFSDGKSALEDFALIKNCDHNITGHSTTFGWWAAYLNDNKNKIVCAPEYYFLHERELIRNSFHPEQWIKI